MIREAYRTALRSGGLVSLQISFPGYDRILFDEKIQGTVHMALGMGYPESGSVNESQIHWDMICDMREGGLILADGEKIYEDGKLLIEPP